MTKTHMYLLVIDGIQNETSVIDFDAIFERVVDGELHVDETHIKLCDVDVIGSEKDVRVRVDWMWYSLYETMECFPIKVMITMVALYDVGYFVF